MTALAGVTTAFPVVRAAAIEAAQPAQQWLIDDLWGRAAVGIIDGRPSAESPGWDSTWPSASPLGRAR